MMSLLNTMLDIALIHREQVAKNAPVDLMYSLSGESWLREYQTVGITAPRQSGKTSLIASRATARDVILVPTVRLANLYASCDAKVIDTYEADALRGFVPEYVYVDEPKICRPGALGGLYELYRNTRKPIFVLLGT